jgi:hypothetical protein
MKRKVVVALACGLFFYSLSDVLLWQRIFEAHDLFQFDAQYQNGHVITLIALIGVGVVMLWDVRLYALWYAGAFFSLAFGGVSDVLYYWIDHRVVPASMPWLNDNPFILFKPAGGWGLAASSAIWVVAWLAILWVAPMMRAQVANRWAPMMRAQVANRWAPLSELDRLAILGHVMRLAALVLVMVTVVGSASLLGMRPHPGQPIATTTTSQARVPQPVTVRPAGGDIAVAGGSVSLIHHPGVPDVYVVPGVGSFVYLTENGECYCGPVVYPSGTIFVPPPSGKFTPCRCMDMRNAPPVYPIIHIVALAAPCRCIDTRLSS